MSDFLYSVKGAIIGTFGTMIILYLLSLIIGSIKLIVNKNDKEN